MARKRKHKRSWLKRLLFFIITPFVVWLLAFVGWLYWDPIVSLFRHGEISSKARPQAPRKINAGEPAGKGVKERISDEDRRRLDEILKKQTN